jgi:hypothetical protein
MIFEGAMLTVTDILALWGAILSTTVLVWDIAKWRMAGPKLQLTVNFDMKSVGIPQYEGKILITAYVVNNGDRSTTITHMAFAHYKSLWDFLRNKTDKNLLVMNPNTDLRLPYELKPGRMWDGIAFQDNVMHECHGPGYLACQIFHTHRNRPVRSVIRIK